MRDDGAEAGKVKPIVPGVARCAPGLQASRPPWMRNEPVAFPGRFDAKEKNMKKLAFIVVVVWTVAMVAGFAVPAEKKEAPKVEERKQLLATIPTEEVIL